jgi:hypothetical protein
VDLEPKGTKEQDMTSAKSSLVTYCKVIKASSASQNSILMRGKDPESYSFFPVVFSLEMISGIYPLPGLPEGSGPGKKRRKHPLRS